MKMVFLKLACTFVIYFGCLAAAEETLAVQKSFSGPSVAPMSGEELIPQSEKGGSGPLTDGLDLNAPANPNPDKQPQREFIDRGGSLDEGCLPADSLVIQPTGPDAVQLHWYAPQSGIYRVYRTDLPNHAPAPTGPDWELVTTQIAVVPTTMSCIDNIAVSPYRNYVVIHECNTPANNDCANATLVGDGIHYYSTLDATTDGPSTACSGNNLQNDIWFKYVATCDIFSIRLCERADNWDVMVTVYNGWNCPAANSEIACDDDGCYPPSGPDLGARVTVQGVAGQQYLIRVGGFFGATGTGNMKIAPGAGNDNCDESSFIHGVAGATYLYTFTNLCATTDGPIETFTNGSPRAITGDLWYELVSSACGTCTLRTCGSNFDTQIAVYDSNQCPVANNTAFVTNDDACGVSSSLTFYVDSQNHYLIRVGGYNGATGSGTLGIVMPTPPANDDCADAIYVGLGQTNFSTINACTDGPMNDQSCQPGHDIWFQTSVGLCSYLDVDLCNSNYDTWLAVYEGDDCSNLGDPVACSDDASECANPLTSKVRFYPTSSGPYLIRVGGYGSQVGTGVLNISQGFVSYMNEDCNNAVALANGTYDLRNNCANTNGDSVTCGQIYNDLWYTIDPPLSSTTTVSLCGSSIDTRLAVYYAIVSPPCDNLSLVACSDDACGDDGEVTFSRGQFSFGVYYVRIGSASVFDEGAITVNITQN